MSYGIYLIFLNILNVRVIYVCRVLFFCWTVDPQGRKRIVPPVGSMHALFWSRPRLIYWAWGMELVVLMFFPMYTLGLFLSFVFLMPHTALAQSINFSFHSCLYYFYEFVFQRWLYCKLNNNNIFFVIILNFISESSSHLIFLCVLLIGRLRPVTPYLGSVPATRGSYVGNFGYQQPVSYSYQQGFMYPSYGWVFVFASMFYTGMLASCCLCAWAHTCSNIYVKKIR